MKTSELLTAKSSFEDNTKWLPFNVHANDTAGIIKRLFNKWIAQNVRRRLCAAIGIESSENAEEIVCNYCKFIALVHDIGKLTPAFQRKLKDNIQGLADRLLDIGIDLSGLTQISESPHNIAGQYILKKNLRLHRQPQSLLVRITAIARRIEGNVHMRLTITDTARLTKMNGHR